MPRDVVLGLRVHAFAPFTVAPLVSLALAFTLTPGVVLRAGEAPQPASGAHIAGPGGLVEHLSVLADGETVALWNRKTGSRIVFWNFRTGKERKPLALQPTVIMPDGKALVAGGRLWDIHTGKEVVFDPKEKYPLPRGELAAITPDGKTMVTAQPQVLIYGPRPPAKVPVARVFDLDAKKRRPFEIFMPVERVVAALGDGNDAIHHIAISPDGKHLALVNNGYTAMFPDLKLKDVWSRIVLFDLVTGAEKQRFHLKGRMEVRALLFTPDSKTLSAGLRPGGVRTWDVARETERILDADTKKMVMSIAITPDGKHLAASNEDQTVVFYALASGKEIGRLPRTSKFGGNPAWQIAFSPDGHTLVACDSGSSRCNVWAWDIREWLKKAAAN